MLIPTRSEESKNPHLGETCWLDACQLPLGIRKTTSSKPDKQVRNRPGVSYHVQRFDILMARDVSLPRIMRTIRNELS